MALCPSLLEVTELRGARRWTCERPEGHDGFHQSMALAPGHELAHRIDPADDVPEATESVDIGRGYRSTATTEVVICWGRPNGGQ